MSCFVTYVTKLKALENKKTELKVRFFKINIEFKLFS